MIPKEGRKRLKEALGRWSLKETYRDHSGPDLKRAALGCSQMRGNAPRWVRSLASYVRDNVKPVGEDRRQSFPTTGNCPYVGFNWQAASGGQRAG